MWSEEAERVTSEHSGWRSVMAPRIEHLLGAAGISNDPRHRIHLRGTGKEVTDIRLPAERSELIVRSVEHGTVPGVRFGLRQLSVNGLIGSLLGEVKSAGSLHRVGRTGEIVEVGRYQRWRV